MGIDLVGTVTLGLEVLFRPEVLFFLVLGVIGGLIIGAIPGLNDNIAFAVFIPFAFSMETATAMALMVGVYCSACIGGSIPAIMVRVPGTASALLTCIDGNAMTHQGKGGQAVGIAISSSVFGGFSSALVLCFFAPILALFALRFGPVENVSLGIMGLASVVGLISGGLVKGCISAVIGLLISMVGFNFGMERFTLGSVNLFDGVPLVPLLVGLFGITAVMELAEDVIRARRANRQIEQIPQIKDVIPSLAMVKRLLPTWVKCSVIGNVIGVIPGAGMLMAIYLGYDNASRTYKRKYANDPTAPKWGEGAPEGVAAPEAANNAVVASSMVPLLALGIPGNSVSALFIAALQVQGMTPGPLLFQRNIDIAWMIILAFVLANLIMGPISFFTVHGLSRLVYKLPKEILATAIVLLCLSGAYAINNDIASIWVALLFGVMGYTFRKMSIPLAPIILAVILGSKIESSFVNSMQITDGNLFVFFDPVNHPISVVLMLVAASFVVGPLIRHRMVNKDG